jgi:hypothetical protein
MKGARRHVHTALLVLLATAACGRSGSGPRAVAPARDRATAEREVEQLDERLNVALLHKDIATLSRSWADDMIYTSATGSVSGKAEQLEYLRSSGIEYEVVTLHDRVIRIYGDTAIVDVRRIEKAHLPDKLIDEQQRITRVYVMRDGGYLLVSSHVSVIEAHHE